MCKNKLNLFDIYNKPILWGQIDSRVLISRLNSFIKEDINYIEINLEMIQSFDESYISTVFIDTLKSFKMSGKELVFIFSNPANEEILFQLSTILLSNKVFSLLKTKTDIEIIGDASYFKKVIFKNINDKKVIKPALICKKYFKSFESSKVEFDEFINTGILEKESDGVYRTNLSFAF